jgi:uncharacterized protein YbjT (DUF2867 family)
MSLFTEDTHFVVFMNAKDPTPSMDLYSREALALVFAEPNKYDATTHFVGQSTILTLTGDRATGEAYCLGVYTGAVSDADLRKITVDYTVEFARVLRPGSPGAAFSFLSGSGADQTGRSRMAFARYKGEAERALVAAAFPRLYIFRPAYIYAVKPRIEPNFSYRLLRAIYPVFRMLLPNQVIPADALARAMVEVAVRKTAEGTNQILENRDIRAMVESLDGQEP